ncbi:MAG: DUF2892 domain-containing protein [Gammaproteobacteria bacterium]|nr:DUF2892 domain-containing protein [Gammaproteobacteria bacterium]MCP5298656.1 DUF2892 domain-containing protein [Chromatiaceae bacterium]
MTKNVGSIDRVIRIIIGVALIVWGYMNQNWWGAVGLVPLLTALIGWCPPYALLGIKTTKS